MKTFETPAGKKIQLKIQENSRLIKIEFATGGELPVELSGLFTTEREASFAVIRYLDSVKDKKLPKEKE
jgi:hypothetical protein